VLHQDLVVRVMTVGGGLRVIAARTTATARAAVAAQRLGSDLAPRLAELMTGAVLIRETTQPARRVQVSWRDRRGGVVVADALPDGSNRGLVNPGVANAVDPGGDHIMQVTYTLPTGTLHQGIVAIPEHLDLGSALMRYMHDSEQVVTMIGVGATAGLEVVAGYLIQVLPEAPRGVVEVLSAHLETLPPFAELIGDGDPRELATRVLPDIDHVELAASELRFGCTCSEARVISSILTLDEAELAAILAGDALDVRCDGCGQSYHVETQAIAAMRTLRARGEQPS
jgi:molecular chaperone Hsp33